MWWGGLWSGAVVEWVRRAVGWQHGVRECVVRWCCDVAVGVERWLVTWGGRVTMVPTNGTDHLPIN